MNIRQGLQESVILNSSPGDLKMNKSTSLLSVLALTAGLALAVPTPAQAAYGTCTVWSLGLTATEKPPFSAIQLLQNSFIITGGESECNLYLGQSYNNYILSGLIAVVSNVLMTHYVGFENQSGPITTYPTPKIAGPYDTSKLPATIQKELASVAAAKGTKHLSRTTEQQLGTTLKAQTFKK